MRTALALVLLLASCSPGSPPYTSTQLAVIKSMHETSLHNRAIRKEEEQYVPLRFGKPEPFTRRDSLNEYLPEVRIQNYFLGEELKRDKLDAENENGDEIVSGTTMTKRELRTKVIRFMDSTLDGNTQQIAQSSKRTLNQTIGHRLLHVCRQGTRIDSGYFVVYNKGSVVVPRQFIAVGF